MKQTFNTRFIQYDFLDKCCERNFFLNQEAQKHGESHAVKLGGHHRESIMKHHKEL